MGDNQYIRQIKAEYTKIDERWLHLHAKIATAIAVVSFFIEIIMCFILNSIDNVVSSTMPVYILKYIVVPSGMNALMVCIIIAALRSTKVSQVFKQYVVSLCLSGICFVLFTVHNIFPSLYLLFLIPIFLTTIYSNFKLSSLTAFVCVISALCGDLLIAWDPDKQPILDNVESTTNFFIMLFLLVCFYFVCLIMIYFQKQKNSASIIKELERLKLQEKLVRDSLTGLYNRSGLRDSFKRMETETAAYIFVMLDLDNFKQINDRHGHLIGDTCLKRAAHVLTKNCGCHPVFRFGGDEFCILFSQTAVDEVVSICQQIQRELLKPPAQAPETALSASFGIAENSPGMTVNELIQNADAALYQAKTAKSCIRVF